MPRRAEEAWARQGKGNGYLVINQKPNSKQK